jgi:glycopeptide antibiotics resistance protein
MPFKEIFRYTIGSNLFYRNIFGNILLFLPFGIFVSKYLDIKKWGYIIFISLIISLTIESIQLVIGRIFDIDDIILNVTGGFLGYIVYITMKRLSDKIPKILKQDWILDFICILLLGGLIWFLIP